MGASPRARQTGARLTKHRLILDPLRAPVVTVIFRMRVVQKLSYTRIAEELNADLQKYPPPQPNRTNTTKHRWTHSAVRSILENPKYTGYQVWNRKARKKRGNRANPVSEWVWSPRPTHEPFVTRQLFDAAWPASSLHPGVRSERTARSTPASTDRSYVLRSYLFCAVCDHRMYGKNSKNRSYYACQPKKDQHYDADWYTAHPKAIWISERVMLEAIHTFFEDRIFGPQRHQLLQAAMTATPTADATNKAAEDIQRLQNEVDSLARRKDLLLDQLAAPEADDTDPDITAEFRRGIRKRFDALEHQRRTALTQLQTHRAEATTHGPGDPSLLEMIPELSFRFSQLPDELQRKIFDAFQLRVRYDGRDRHAKLQVTILAAIARDLTQLAERAGTATRAVDRP